MKDNSKHTVILYLHYLGRQKDLITNNTLEATKNKRLVWQTIKGIINMKNKSDESIFSLLIDNQLITNAKQISNHFNHIFTSIDEKINRNLENNNIIFLSPTVPEDKEDLISSTKSNTASGPNSIPNNICNIVKKELSKSLSDMTNMSFNEGVFYK